MKENKLLRFYRQSPGKWKMLWLYRKEFSVTFEVITQSPILPGQNPALFLPHLVQSILSYLAESQSSPLSEHKFQVWIEWQVDTTITKCSFLQKCIQVGQLLPYQNSPHSMIYIYNVQQILLWLNVPVLLICLIVLSRSHKDMVTGVNIKATVFKKCDNTF